MVYEYREKKIVCKNGKTCMKGKFQVPPLEGEKGGGWKRMKVENSYRVDDFP